MVEWGYNLVHSLKESKTKGSRPLGEYRDILGILFHLNVSFIYK